MDFDSSDFISKEFPLLEVLDGEAENKKNQRKWWKYNKIECWRAIFYHIENNFTRW